MEINSYGINSYTNQQWRPLTASTSFVGNLKTESAQSITTSQVFADEILKRTADTAKPQDSTGVQDQDQVLNSDQTRAQLGAALSGTVDFIRSNYGKDAATASMAIMLKNVNQGAGEEQLGSALLQVVKFMDKNIGIAAGDKVIDQLNGDLNNALNNHFKNGLNEQFIAKTLSPGSLSNYIGDLRGQASEQATKTQLESLQAMLEDMVSEETDFKSYRHSLDQVESTVAGLQDHLDLSTAQNPVVSQYASMQASSGVNSGAVIDTTV